MALGLFSSSPVILDGGLGTTLNELFGVDTSQSPLWCAQQVLEDPGVIVETHLAFLRAGAQIILTSTYQCSTSTFRHAGLSEEVAQKTMLEAVYLAEKAQTIYREEISNAGKIKIALSLGPFGSTLSPGQEYDGFYPPPYGPMGFSDDDARTNSFGQDIERESASIDALAKFHLDRLVAFSRDPKAWGAIDIIAFETVPLVREVKAIRKTMAQLFHPVGGNDLKPWWISCVFPNGNCPEEKYPGGPNLTACDVVAAALCRGHDMKGPVPTAVGVNCTSPDLLPTLVNEMKLARQDHYGTDEASPWLVLYPNNGDLYDPIHKDWKVEPNRRKQKDKWEGDLAKVVQELSGDCPGIWRGFLVGGCCRTGPVEIRGLRDRLLGQGK